MELGTWNYILIAIGVLLIVDVVGIRLWLGARRRAQRKKAAAQGGAASSNGGSEPTSTGNSKNMDRFIGIVAALSVVLGMILIAVGFYM